MVAPIPKKYKVFTRLQGQSVTIFLRAAIRSHRTEVKLFPFPFPYPAYPAYPAYSPFPVARGWHAWESVNQVGKKEEMKKTQV